MQFKKVNNKEHHHSLVVRGFFMNAHVSEFHMLFVWGVFVCVPWVWTCSVVRGGVSSLSKQFSPPLPPSFHCLFSVMGACFPFLCGDSQLGCQDLPAMGEVSIQELAANNYCGSSWMFWASNLHLTMQLLKVTFLKWCRLVMIYCAHNWFFRRVHFIIPASKQTKDKTRRG